MPARRRDRIDGLTRAGLVAIAGGRLAIGASVWVRPQWALRALGFRHSSTAEEALARIAGTRDLALAALQLTALSSRERSRGLAKAAAGVDAGDAAAFGLLLARGEQRAAATIGVATAAAAALAGGWLSARLE